MTADRGIATRPQLLCTVRRCHEPLEQDGRRYLCPNRHSFDLARSGYLNLLQPQDRRSSAPGDSVEAVAARRRFLDRGIAAPLVEIIASALPLHEGDALLDVGCGEGHQLAAFARHMPVVATGIDISVPAIDLAARRHRNAFFVVANADRFLPWADASFDALASITARMNPAEFRRVLRPSGSALVVLPGPDDLLELRERVYKEGVERDRVERTIELFSGTFRLDRHQRATHRAMLDPHAITEVLDSSYRALRLRERERAAGLGPMEVTMSRDILLFKPRR